MHFKSLTQSLGVRTFVVALLGVSALQVWAQDRFPSQPIKLVVPFAPGGGADTLARVIAPKLGEAFKQNVVVDNRPGGSGVIATNHVIKSAADGHTVLLHAMSIVTTPAMFANPPYDTLKDLTPVVELIYTPLWLAVSTQRTQAKTLTEFIEQVRLEPKKHNYASISPGSSGHLMGFQFNEQNKLDMEHVGYKGAAPATQALLTGEITAAFLDYSTLKAHVATGKMRVLGVTGVRRSTQTPDLATFKELGVEGFDKVSWAGLFVPRATPPAVVQQLTDAVNRVLQEPDVSSKFTSMGYDMSIKTQAQFADQVLRDGIHWSAILRAAGVKAQ
jgi:tripartite-type tricarboxylate transporter receptor subunit TctC